MAVHAPLNIADIICCVVIKKIKNFNLLIDETRCGIVTRNDILQVLSICNATVINLKHCIFQNEQSSTEDTAFKKSDKKEAKESSSSSSSGAGSSKDDKTKSMYGVIIQKKYTHDFVWIQFYCWSHFWPFFSFYLTKSSCLVTHPD